MRKKRLNDLIKKESTAILCSHFISCVLESSRLLKRRK